MHNAKKEDRKNEDKLLRIRTDAELPDHKEAASLDDLDRDILEMCLEDIFFTYAELAEKWDVTVATIRNRIKRMKASGVMDAILVINPYKIGFKTFAIIGIKLGSGADPDEVASTLLSIPGVTNIVMVAGRYDFIFNYVCQNMEFYRQFVSEQLRKIPGISIYEDFVGLDLYERKFELGIIR
jgi:Lrp/AsnC family transcriptional regulator for asnA, asnC and gidA